jgi:hypothetical protein
MRQRRTGPVARVSSIKEESKRWIQVARLVDVKGVAGDSSAPWATSRLLISFEALLHPAHRVKRAALDLAMTRLDRRGWAGSTPFW